MYEALHGAPKKILVEGANAALLDIDFGTSLPCPWFRIPTAFCMCWEPGACGDARGSGLSLFHSHSATLPAFSASAGQGEGKGGVADEAFGLSSAPQVWQWTPGWLGHLGPHWEQPAPSCPGPHTAMCAAWPCTRYFLRVGSRPCLLLRGVLGPGLQGRMKPQPVAALSHRDLPLCDVIQLHSGWRVHGPGHPTPEHRRCVWRGEGLHHPRGHRGLPHRANQRECPAWAAGGAAGTLLSRTSSPAQACTQ